MKVVRTTLNGKLQGWFIELDEGGLVFVIHRSPRAIQKGVSVSSLVLRDLIRTSTKAVVVQIRVGSAWQFYTTWVQDFLTDQKPGVGPLIEWTNKGKMHTLPAPFFRVTPTNDPEQIARRVHIRK